jgi:5'-nucleotidase
MGRQHYWFTVEPIEQTEPGTDIWAMEHGEISITPLVLDVTDHDALERLQARRPFGGD